MTGIGAVQVRQPRLRDRGAEGERIKFRPSILPPYARRSKSLEVLLPILYLKGLSTGDFGEALTAILGKEAPGVSASTIARLKAAWADEHRIWEKRDLSAKRYVYVWADGIHLQARLEDDAQCILVLLGATPEGTKEMIGFIDGVRESAQKQAPTKSEPAFLNHIQFSVALFATILPPPLIPPTLVFIFAISVMTRVDVMFAVVRAIVLRFLFVAPIVPIVIAVPIAVTVAKCSVSQ